MASLDLNLDAWFAGPDDVFDESCHNYRNDKEYQIMKDFLQPDSTICLEAAANSLLDLIPEHTTNKGIVGIIHLCAHVIPWHHTSHLKLAWLAERLRWSNKMSPHLDMIKSASDSFYLTACFSDALWDDYDDAGRYGPDSQSELDQWVNFNAYLANLDALHFWGDQERFVWRTMAYAFKHPPGDLEAWYRDPNDEGYGVRCRDANILAAAQWILWDGQNLRRHAIYTGPPKGSTVSAERFFSLEAAETTLERWQVWKQGFGSARNDDTVAGEVRSVATRAFVLMEALEQTMPS